MPTLLSYLSLRRLVTSTQALTLGLGLTLGMGMTSSAEAAAPIAPDVMTRLAAQPDGSVFVYLKTKADLTPAQNMADKKARGRFVLQALQSTAQKSQGALIQALKARGVQYQSYYVTNAIQVWATPALVTWLSERPEVERIDYNNAFNMLETPVEEKEAPTLANGVEWNITAIKAPSVWSMGYKGKGVVVAGNDTGVDWTHPAITRQYRGYTGSTTTVNHNYNWFDGVSKTPQSVPFDDHGHGTFTVGEMVGDDGNGNQIGVAPEATWIGCKNMNAAGVGTVESYTKCFQFFIAPTDTAGNNPDPSKAPDVVNNSWGCPADEGCNKDTLHTIVNNVQAAGVMLIFSAGNNGPSCSTVLDPPGTYPEVLSIGAIDSSGEIASFSSRGPSAFDRGIKPNLAAPGQGVRSCVPKNSYTSMSGTSMAAPLVVGTTALMWSARPDMIGNFTSTWSTLTGTTTKKRAPRCGGDSSGNINNVYGTGNLNAKAAVDAMLALP